MMKVNSLISPSSRYGARKPFSSKAQKSRVGPILTPVHDVIPRRLAVFSATFQAKPTCPLRSHTQCPTAYPVPDDERNGSNPARRGPATSPPATAHLNEKPAVQRCKHIRIGSLPWRSGLLFLAAVSPTPVRITVSRCGASLYDAMVHAPTFPGSPSPRLCYA